MEGPTARKIGGKKFMWDGSVFGTEQEARAGAEKYRAEGFDAEIVEEGGSYHVLTRRVVTDVKVEGGSPV